MYNSEFNINDDNYVLSQCYRNDNYKIMHGYAKNGRCYIFCSSNGIYFHNEYEEFENKVIGHDRYDFDETSKRMLPYADKIILMRDIRKNFYVTGLNENINSIDDILFFF